MPTLEEMYNSIPIGRENAISKEALAELWGYKTERAVREKIAEMRAVDNGDNYVIVSLSNNKGYYRTDDTEEIMAFKHEVTSRARHTFIPLKKVNRVLMDINNEQLELLPLNNLKEDEKNDHSKRKSYSHA